MPSALPDPDAELEPGRSSGVPTVAVVDDGYGFGFGVRLMGNADMNADEPLCACQSSEVRYVVLGYGVRGRG